ncbi:CSGA-like protein [Mya arenaria]|uniref:CSGA-like protein n=1 Tax=Mya arenaria TaxID=6604 RepID=A0ABY7ECD5_MYAAR|nr:CSGA-like protein [Mya arenaria]
MALCPKSVLVTGANRGIGLEFVRQFLALKTPPKFIFACCRAPDNAADLKSIAEKSPSVHVVKLDGARGYVESIVGADGLNLLINNAAVGVRKSLQEALLPLLKQAASLSPDAPMSCSRAAIINISTGVASISENSSGGSYAYRPSKAALNMITTNLALELKEDGILATAVHPGWVKTEMGGPNALIDTGESITKMMSVLAKLQGEEGTGKFYHGVRGDLIVSGRPSKSSKLLFRPELMLEMLENWCALEEFVNDTFGHSYDCEFLSSSSAGLFAVGQGDGCVKCGEWGLVCISLPKLNGTLWHTNSDRVLSDSLPFISWEDGDLSELVSEQVSASDCRLPLCLRSPLILESSELL